MTEETIFADALARPIAERAAYLDAVCAGQPELRQRLEALLAAHAQPDFTGAYASAIPTPGESVGTVIADKYKLLQEIGAGGMGSVFMADQLQPVKRRVAVKIIKAGMDTAHVLARFEAERQALALMDHPNIGKVFDAGSTQTNRPFFVMELVKGIPLTPFCDQHKLSMSDRLKLFQQICGAVQHAHQKGIIHRDLKPTNILVESHDGTPVPKVIDFGLAKATSGVPLTEHTLFTAFGTVAGTPLYMAPEQAAFNAIDVDTRADIYALGVILYELLTGTTPIERMTFKKAAFDEMLRVIREIEPPTPSNRISSSETKASVAAVRGMEPAKLGRFVKGELDWIVMKALSKERDRRYETANGFARDIERFLNHEPVVAGPPSTRYKLRKFVQRNRGQVIAGSLVLLALLGGVIGTTGGMLWAIQARRDETEQKKIAVNEKKKAEQAEADTLADYRASTDDAIKQLIGSKPELGAKEKAYLEQTLKRWQAFANRQGDDERSRTIRGEGHHRVADLWSALGRKQEARAEYEAALDLRKKLAEQFPDVAEYQHNLAATYNTLGVMFEDLGKQEDARWNLQAALDIQKKLVEHFPTVPEYQMSLANTHYHRGYFFAGFSKREEAKVEYLAALDIDMKLVQQFPSEPSYQSRLVATQVALGFLLHQLKKFDESRAQYEAALNSAKKLADQFPNVPEHQMHLAGTHQALGIRMKELQKFSEAIAECQAALDIDNKLVEQFPAVPDYLQAQGFAHNNLGIMYLKINQLQEARREFQAALDIKKKLVELFPSVPTYQRELARSLSNMGELLVSFRKPEEAGAAYLSAIDIQKKLVAQFPERPDYQIALGNSYFAYGTQFARRGKPAESLEWFDHAVQTLKPVLDKLPEDLAAKTDLRESHRNRALANNQLKKFADAVKDWDRAIELSPTTEKPGMSAMRAASLIQANRFTEAVAQVAELTDPVANAPGAPNWKAGQWYNFACIYSIASSKLADKKQEYADRAMELLQKAVKAGYKDADHMKKDTDLDPLRDRDDFKKLIADVEKSRPTNVGNQP